MSNTALYRIASVLFILFAAGHTFGFLNFTPPTAAGIAVRDAMNNVHFTADGETFSYGEFYRGLGLSATVFLLFQAFLAWQLGSMARKAPQLAAPIAWGLSLVQVLGVAISCRYLASIPAIFSLVLAICLGWAAWRLPASQQALPVK
jgi:hypothetical protein